MVPGKSHGPARRPRLPRIPKGALAAGEAPVVVNATSTNWSGSVAFAPANTTFRWVEGQWTVPNSHAPALGSYYASEWVGIDGWNSPDVLQAGTETAIADLGIFTARSTYAWWEWFPAGEVAITNLPVSPGDVMYSLICATSNTTASVYISNQSSSLTTSFTINAPQGSSLAGNCAEWVVERPTVGGNLASLTDYDAVYIDEGVAGWTGGNKIGIVTSGSGTPITMTGNANASLSVPVFENSELIKLDWQKSS